MIHDKTDKQILMALIEQQIDTSRRARDGMKPEERYWHFYDLDLLRAINLKASAEKLPENFKLGG